MQRSLAFFILIMALIPSKPGFTWSASGHKIIAQIAYDQLTPRARQYYVHLNHHLNQRRRSTFVLAAVWLDTLYDPRYLAFKLMHYIDIPESIDGTKVPKLSAMNAIVALQQAKETLQDTRATLVEKTVALRIILHVVGDIHQPLHTITRVSRAHRKGDRGGNDFHLAKNKIGNNLHQYWDKGGGYLSPHLSAATVKNMAKNLVSQWPCPPDDLNVLHWVQASHLLAIRDAYAIKENEIPSEEYSQTTQRITQQQLVYAGCRLSLLLNQNV